MDTLLLSSAVLIGGALVLTAIAGGPTLWRYLKKLIKGGPHGKT